MLWRTPSVFLPLPSLPAPQLLLAPLSKRRPSLTLS